MALAWKHFLDAKMKILPFLIKQTIRTHPSLAHSLVSSRSFCESMKIFCPLRCHVVVFAVRRDSVVRKNKSCCENRKNAGWPNARLRLSDMWEKYASRGKNGLFYVREIVGRVRTSFFIMMITIFLSIIHQHFTFLFPGPFQR